MAMLYPISLFSSQRNQESLCMMQTKQIFVKLLITSLIFWKCVTSRSRHIPTQSTNEVGRRIMSGFLYTCQSTALYHFLEILVPSLHIFVHNLCIINSIAQPCTRKHYAIMSVSIETTYFHIQDDKQHLEKNLVVISVSATWHQRTIMAEDISG